MKPFLFIVAVALGMSIAEAKIANKQVEQVCHSVLGFEVHIDSKSRRLYPAGHRWAATEAEVAAYGRDYRALEIFADKGDADAEECLGQHMHRVEPPTRDWDAVVLNLWRRAAENRNPIALLDLASANAEGEMGLPKNCALGEQYMLAALDAANVGNDLQLRDMVLVSLGTLHQGSCPESVAAYKWRIVCGKLGSHKDDFSGGNVCESMRLTLSPLMTREQITEAQRQAVPLIERFKPPSLAQVTPLPRPRPNF
jgi:TPR repeat protein